MAIITQNQELAEWLQMYGCPLELTKQDLMRLNSPKMRSTWRLLQRHIKPFAAVRILKRNLLLSWLKKNGSPENCGQFNIESVEQLLQLQKHTDIEQEIHNLKERREMVDTNLLSANISLGSKVSELDVMRHDLEEIQEKSALLNLKYASLKREVEELDEKLKEAEDLKLCSLTQVSYLEVKENQLLIAKFVQNVASVGNVNDCISQMISEIGVLPPAVIFNGLLAVSNQIVSTLDCLKFTEYRAQNYPDTKNKTDILQLSNNVQDLNKALYKNEFDIHRYLGTVFENQNELERERAILITILEELVPVDSKQGDDYILIAIKLIRTIIDRFQNKYKNEVMKKLKIELEDLCNLELDSAKCVLDDFEGKGNELFKQVNEKLCGINKLLKDINIQVNLRNHENPLKVKNLASIFLTELENNTEKENKFQILVSENLVGQEIEIFQKLDLLAMTRQWEDSSYDIAPINIKKDILKNSELLKFLLYSEPKNLIKSVIERIYWLHVIFNSDILDSKITF